MSLIKKLSGKLVIQRLGSEVLKSNPLGDPALRDLYIYLPPGYESLARPCPALLAVVGFTGTGASLFNIDPLGEDLKSRLDRLVSSLWLKAAVIPAGSPPGS